MMVTFARSVCADSDVKLGVIVGDVSFLDELLLFNPFHRSLMAWSLFIFN